jgi:hypothetical protein
MADTPMGKGIGEVFAHMKEKVAQEVEQHKDEEVDLEDLEDVSGGWTITYGTDPKKKPEFT